MSLQARIEALWDKRDTLTSATQGQPREDVQAALEMLDLLKGQVAPGDVIMIKGSNGARMGAVVSALKQRYAAAPAKDIEG